MTGWTSAVTGLRSGGAEGEGCGSAVAAAGSETSLKTGEKYIKVEWQNQTRKNPTNFWFWLYIIKYRNSC